MMLFGRQGRTYRYRRRIKNSVKDEHWCVVLLFFILGTCFFVGIPMYAYSCEQELHEMTLAFEEAKDNVISLPSDANPHPAHSGQLLHMQSSSIEPTSVQIDQDFGVANPRSLKMNRVPEFCQWIETYTERTRKINDNEEEVIRTYHYTKGWVSFPINSLFFDQPFGHFNPQDNPFPSRYWVAEKAKFGDYTLDEDIINSITSFGTELWDADNLNSFEQSPAADNAFRYIGNGYFYYAYEKSAMEAIALAAGQFLDGSLLDIQLFDFLPGCTAGDIRVHHQTIHPNEATVIGFQKDSTGALGGWRSSRGYVVAILREGLFSAEGVLDAALSEYLHWTVWVSRFILMIWGFAVIGFTIPGQDIIFYLFISTLFTLATLGMMWFVISPEIISIAAFLSLVFVIMSASILKDWIIASPPPNTNTSNINLKKKSG